MFREREICMFITYIQMANYKIGWMQEQPGVYAKKDEEMRTCPGLFMDDQIHH